MNAGAFCFCLFIRRTNSPVSLEENVKGFIRSAALAVTYLAEPER